MVYKYRKNLLEPSHHFLKSIPNNGKLVTEEQVCYILLYLMEFNAILGRMQYCLGAIFDAVMVFMTHKHYWQDVGIEKLGGIL